MCWFTLTPVKHKKHKRPSSDSSCAEELVRVHHNSSPRFSDIKVKLPSSATMELEHQHQHHRPHHPHLHPHLHHHHLPHLHPLHLHPIHDPHPYRRHEKSSAKLHGQGRKLSSPSPGPPPPSRDPSTCRPRSRSPSSRPPASCEPIYRTQIVEPATVRETTRVALHSMQSGRRQSRLRRVAGYEVLGRELPWQWDCISSTVGSSSVDRGKRTRRNGRGGLKYPPFGGLEKWM
ncbi:hypothetical protein T440DRAFT_277042 [Plenodomus tracheiphilus IPT5]|uniref:Uncharacterized protein n=1 Tax=Plenodomus tracheiphilus IPT5 TaxID=1408161 RepID=A0A6A7ATH1_9PLEO|nr:hypothetical protein T440DRAFT_277042 [Plenodomus tracheiphilus IPT5]